jgi:hypothetical protein
MFFLHKMPFLKSDKAWIELHIKQELYETGVNYNNVIWQLSVQTWISPNSVK